MSSTAISGNGFSDQSGARAVTLIALLSGLTLLAAWQLRDSLPTTLRFIWITVALMPPLLLGLLLRSATDRRSWWLVALLTPLLAGLAWYSGHSGLPADARNLDSALPGHLLVIGIALFLLCPYLQQWRDGERPIYARLFHNAWDNALTLVVAAVLTGASWLILLLWAALFRLIGIKLFETLFSDPLFAYPTAGLLLGLGVALARTQGGALRNLLRICMTLGQLLLPLLALVAVIFLPALAFTGLEPLWNTGSATSLLLALVLGLVSLVNSVYQDGEQTAPYGLALRRLLNLALLSLPVYAVIAVIALNLRVGQHGWSVDRLWAAVLVGIALLYGTSYALAALWRGPVWLAPLAPLNRGIALLLAAVLLLTQSPLFDMRQISVNSQLARVERGELALDQLDLRYFHWELGRSGRDALLRLRDEGRIKPETLAALFAQKHRWDSRLNVSPAMIDTIPVLPAGTPLPPALRNFLGGARSDEFFGLSACTLETRGCRLLNLDLDADGLANEWLLVLPYGSDWPVLGEQDGHWKQLGQLSNDSWPKDEALRALDEGRYTLEAPRWQQLVIDRQRYSGQPRE